MKRFTVVYDACVLYPAHLRDLMMHLALTNLFKAHWTDKIHAEWMDALLRTGRFNAKKLRRVRDLMDAYAADAKVTGYEPLIESLNLPDPDDRHVLAAAIRCNADAIITFNRKDFPEPVMKSYDIDIIHPDDFVFYQIELSPAECCYAIKQQRKALHHPPLTVEQFLTTLQRQQLPQTVSLLRDYAHLL